VTDRGGQRGSGDFGGGARRCEAPPDSYRSRGRTRVLNPLRATLAAA